MIARLRLKNWRSFDSLDVSFGPGTTFIVAPNGVGKTSLVLGLAWGVFGDASGVDARSAVRAGASSAEVHVAVILPDGRELNIERRVTAAGKAKMTATIDQHVVENIAETLSAAFAVDTSIAARLSLMLGAGNNSSTQSQDLKSHLNRVFGIDHLVQLESIAVASAKQATKTRLQFRESTKQRLSNRAAVEEELQSVRNQVVEQNQRRETLAQDLELSDRRRREASQLVSLRQDHTAYQQSLEDILQDAEAVLQNMSTEEALSPSEISDLVGREEIATKAANKQSLEQAAQAAARQTVAKEAVRILESADAHCPTCLRPLDETTIGGATGHHEHEIEQANEVIRSERARQNDLDGHLATLAALRSRLDQLRPPASQLAAADPNEPTDLVAAAETRFSEATTAMREHDERFGALQLHLRELEGRVASDDAIANSENELRRAYRAEGIATAAASAISNTLEHLGRTQIEPIATEVTYRWKRLFNNDGLTLRPDGNIVRVHGGQELGWETLSGGEQIWARIVTHLLLLSSCTQLPFALLDEPLEHLDPKLRHSVASTLAYSTAHNPTTQLIVTTYENAIARQLAADTPDSHLINIRSGLGLSAAPPLPTRSVRATRLRPTA